MPWRTSAWSSAMTMRMTGRRCMRGSPLVTAVDAHGGAGHRRAGEFEAALAAAWRRGRVMLEAWPSPASRAADAVVGDAMAVARLPPPPARLEAAPGALPWRRHAGRAASVMTRNSSSLVRGKIRGRRPGPAQLQTLRRPALGQIAADARQRPRLLTAAQFPASRPARAEFHARWRAASSREAAAAAAGSSRRSRALSCGSAQGLCLTVSQGSRARRAFLQRGEGARERTRLRSSWPCVQLAGQAPEIVLGVVR